MATFAVGDIHGNLDALRDLLDQLALEARRGDTIVFLGDYVDRGRDSKGCIDAILGFEQSVDAEVVCLLGNHEDWLLRTMRDYCDHSWLLGMEGFATIRSYSADAEEAIRAAASGATRQLYGGTVQLPYDAFFDSVPPDHIRFFEGLRLCYDNADGICSHGGLDPRVANLSDQTRMALIWGAGGFPEAYRGDQVVVYGHRDNALVNGDGWPLPAEDARTIGIDTISRGVLTAIRLPDRRVFQSARYTTDRHDA
jgi:serine/threonine protein phosphatase 1